MRKYMRKYNKTYYAIPEIKEKKLNYMKEYYIKNKEAITIRQKKYYKKHPRTKKPVRLPFKHLTPIERFILIEDISIKVNKELDEKGGKNETNNDKI